MTLVERLRQNIWVGTICDEAADRIVALEAKLQEIQIECEEWPCGDNDPLVVSIFKIIARAG